METKAFKDMGKEKLGYAGSINVFGTGSKDYPLCKAMVNHDHQGIMARGWGKISDEVNEELLEWEKQGRGNGKQWWACGIMVHLVLLASSTTRDEGSDKGG